MTLKLIPSLFKKRGQVNSWDGNKMALKDLPTVTSLSSGTSTDIDINPAATILKQSAILEEGIYLVIAGLRTDTYITLAGWASMKLWLAHGTTQIDGSLREVMTNLGADAEKVVSLQTGAIYAFNGKEKATLYAQATELCSGHDCNLLIIKLTPTAA